MAGTMIERRIINHSDAGMEIINILVSYFSRYDS